jgi:hypothetical protein
LFLSLCIGGLISGYQSGYRAGYGAGQSTRYDETQVVQTYSTIGFIWPDLPEAERMAAIEQLKQLITSTVATDIWADGRGNEIREFPTNQSIIVCAPGSVQREIADLIKQLENLSTHGGGEEMLGALQALASQGKQQVKDFDIKAPKNSQMAQAWLEKYYAATIEGVSTHWGTPRYQGECHDKKFPQWSTDQRLATWRRGDGFIYLGLRYVDDGQLHIVAGWRKQS